MPQPVVVRGHRPTRGLTMFNAVPVIGWLVSLLISASLAVPFWIVWTGFGIGADYFYWLPEVYHRPGFWSCVGFFIAVSILKFVLTPRFVFVSSNSSKS